jgi:rhomboid family protein
MNEDRSPFALTPWTRRFMAANGAVYLLQLTVFTGTWPVEMFGFAAREVVQRPWSVLTYAFLHGSFLHLFGNMLGLFMFGPPVERRFGSRAFLRLYLFAALGGPLLSLAMLPLAGGAPIIGASAAVYGVMLAFVMAWPDAPVMIFPFPVPVRVKWIVGFMVIWSLVAGSQGLQPGVAHFAHLGGFAAAWIYLKVAGLVGRPTVLRPSDRPPAVLVRPPAADAGRRAEFGASPPRRSPDAAVREEVDRVLDKISQRGLDSLTPEERRFLDEMSRRFRQSH